MKKPELLAPAGDMECLRTALHFGADAVYVGGPKLQLRADGVGFTMDGLAEAAETVHAAGRRIYVTVNCFAENGEIELAGDYARELFGMGIDAAIISDIGIMAEFRRAAPELELHVSTQANCQNYAAALVYYGMGAKRIVLAREMTLPQIAQLREKVPADLELEGFVHGAMCVSYSGRCLLSAYMTGRSGNRGQCAQPCRWRWYLNEESRPGEYFPIVESEDGRGTAILSSRDLCAIGFLDKLAAVGVSSFKIEGRMKSPYYVGTVTNAYRTAIDALARGETPDIPALTAELCAVSHRDLTRGFYFGEVANETHARDGYAQTHTFAGVVLESGNGRIVFGQRNRIHSGDTLELVSPGIPARSFTVGEMFTTDGEPTDDAKTPAGVYEVECGFTAEKGDLLRRRIDKN
jgi:putative protease